MIESGALDVTIVIPAFNEANRLPRTLTALTSWIATRPEQFEVIVVDDGSTDGTSAIADNFPTITFSALPYNQGKGAAVRHGMLLAAGDLILMMDADLATPLSEYDLLKESITAGADIAIGWVNGNSAYLKVRSLVIYLLFKKSISIF